MASLDDTVNKPKPNTGPSDADNARASESEVKDASKIRQEALGGTSTKAKPKIPPTADELSEQPVTPSGGTSPAKPNFELFSRLANTLGGFGSPPSKPLVNKTGNDDDNGDDDDKQIKKSAPNVAWPLFSLLGKGLEGGGRTLGAVNRGIGAVLGAGAKALGNMGAAMNTAGAGQAAAYGNTPGVAAAAVMQGLGDTGAVGAQALGDIIGTAQEDFFSNLGTTAQDYASHLELNDIQDEMLGELQRQIEWANAKGVPLDRAGIYETWKNIFNSAGSVSSSLIRNRRSVMPPKLQATGGYR
jgi:hypothetical protein